jgi:hypothetical protein
MNLRGSGKLRSRKDLLKFMSEARLHVAVPRYWHLRLIVLFTEPYFHALFSISRKHQHMILYAGLLPGLAASSVNCASRFSHIETVAPGISDPSVM